MPNNEERLAEEVARITELAKTDKNIKADVLIESLFNQQTQTLPSRLKIRAYLVSLLFPPFGFYYVFKFLFREESDARQTALVCGVLTVVAILLLVWLSFLFTSSPGLDQVKNITPQQIQETLQ